MSDQINPIYYRDGGVECIDAMPEYFREWLAKRPHFIQSVNLMMLGFCLGNAFKYRWRAGGKKGEPIDRDLTKAEWYEAFALHLVDASKPDPRGAR